MAVVNDGDGDGGGGVQVSEEGFSEHCEIVAPSYDRSCPGPEPGSGDGNGNDAKNTRSKRVGSTEIGRGRAAFQGVGKNTMAMVL